jgi:Spy/CpxP family protein refolding chaperone
MAWRELRVATSATGRTPQETTNMAHASISRFRLALVLSASLAVAAHASAAPPGMDHGPPRGDPAGLFERNAERLGLEPEVLATIQRIVQESRAQAETLHRQTRAAHEAMHALLSQERPDEAAVMRQAEIVAALELDQRKNRLRSILAIRELLTPQQRAELVKLRSEEWGARRRRGPLGACTDDLRLLCSDVVDSRAALACLAEHHDDLTAPCRSALDPTP